MARLEAYDPDGRVIATLDLLVTRTDKGPRLVDFQAHHDAGLKLRKIWDVEKARGSRLREEPDG